MEGGEGIDLFKIKTYERTYRRMEKEKKILEQLRILLSSE